MLVVHEHWVGLDLANVLLALPTTDGRAALLREKGLLDAGGLDGLLDLADGLLDSDPARAGELAMLCSDLAEEAAAPAAVPRASYIRAGAHSIAGEFEEDLRLTAAAREGFLALGMNLQALRTDVGKMAALLELGRYQETLATGRSVLEALDGEGDLAVSPSPEESDLLMALVHQNLGGCLEFMGRYEEALEAYTVSEERYRVLGMDERAGEILDNRGKVLSQIGRVNEALAAHEAAARVFEEASLTLRYAKALANVGEARRQLADYARSLQTFERARELYEALDARADASLLLLDTANAYLELNLYPEALASYREAAGPLGAAGMVHNRARALWGYGVTLVALSDLEAAGEALEEAARLFEGAGNTPLLCSVLLEQAALLEARGDREDSLALAKRTLGLVSGGEWPVQSFYAHLRLADLSLPDKKEAVEEHLLAARRLSEGLALPHLGYRLDERLGRLRRLQGREEEARTLLQAAVDVIEDLRGSVAHETMRASFLRDKTAAYEELLRLHLDGEDPRRAFAVSERARSRALADLLVVGGTETVAFADGDPGISRRMDALQADLNATYNRLLGDAGEDGTSAPRTLLRRRAGELEEEIGRLRLRGAARVEVPDPFALFSQPEDERLPSDTALVAYHVVGHEVVAFVEVGAEMRVVRGLGPAGGVKRLLRRLDRQWNRFRLGEEFVEENAAQLEESAQKSLASLHQALVAPLEGPLEAAPRKLVVVPHGPLHRVPFHALHDGERYLLERFEVSYAPSARVHALCQNKERRGTDRALVMGVDDGSIPHVTEEARAVGSSLGAEVLTGERATLGALREKAPGRGVVHLACHGLYRHDNPMFSSLKLYDGWFTAADLLQLDLEGALVVLSACESGRSRVFEGDELIGLTRAFLGAGAATLVSSLWIVQDETTAELMRRCHERLRAGSGPAEALREAQLALKEERPHPYYWAPFVLVGKR